MQFILMLSNTLQITEKVFTRQKKELKLQVVPEKLKSKKVQELQELVVLKTHYLEVVEEYLDLDQDHMIRR